MRGRGDKGGEKEWEKGVRYLGRGGEGGGDIERVRGLLRGRRRGIF